MRATSGATSSAAPAWAARALGRQAMPLDEIRAVVEADDPRIVHRYLSLHRERLEELAAEQRRTLEDLERLLVAEAVERTSTRSARSQRSGS